MRGEETETNGGNKKGGGERQRLRRIKLEKRKRNMAEHESIDSANIRCVSSFLSGSPSLAAGNQLTLRWT